MQVIFGKQNHGFLKTISYSIFFVWEKFEHDNSVDEEPKLPNYKENHYFLLQFNNGKLDTISKNNEQLEKQFSKIIKKESL